ncbi:MAG TPA: ice-binding family protein [Pirellulales bacterium]|nr:ice-binding family protein [Pirellulales bacterium]
MLLAVDLSITNTAAPTTGTVNQPETYTITVKNNDATNAAAGVVMTDALPANAMFVSASDGNSHAALTPTGGVLTDAIGAMVAGATDTITVVATPTTAGAITNTATVATTSGDPNPANNTATVTTPVNGIVTPAIDLSITKTAAPTIDAILGSANSFAVLASSTVTNTGPSVITGNLGVSPGTALAGFSPAVVNGTIHAGDAVAAQAQSDLHTAYNILAGRAATTNLTGQNLGGLTLTPGVYHFNSSAQLSGTLTLDAQGNPNAEFDFQIGSTLTTATGSAVRVINSGNDANVFWQVGSSATLGTATAFEGSILAFSSITVNTGSSIADGRALALSGAVTLADNAISIPAPGMVGANETYTIVVKNNDATNNATGVTMTDTLPANTTFVSAKDTTSGATLTPTGGLLTDAIGNLAANGTDTITVVVTPTAAGTITNTANVEGNQADNNQANNTATVTTTVNGAATPAIDLSITKTAAPTTGTVGVNETYTIVVKNNDTTNNATGVSMTDTLPANTTFVSAKDTTSGATLTPTGGLLTDAIGNLAANGTDTITVVVTPTAAGTITNTANVEGNQADNNTANNTATVITTINPASTAADLSITKIASPEPDTVGQNLTYTITVINSGNAGANSTVVTDTLPAGLTVVSVSDSQNGTNTQSGNTVTDNLGTLAAGSTATVTIVVTPSQTGTLTNTASVTTTSTNTGTTTTASATSTVTGATPPPTGVTCFVAGQAGDNTDQTFVRNLYRELLGREPDSAGQASWLKFLAGDQGHSDSARRASVISDFLDSPEYKQHLVTCIFELFLHRAPDAQGLQYWVGALGQPGNPGSHSEGSDEMGVVSDIVGSPEYFALRGNTNLGYVEGLYQDLLGRAPDAGGEAYWMGQVTRSGGDRSAVARSFVGAPEAEHKLLNANYPAAGNASDLTLSPAGSPQGGQYAMADLTGGGWENLYFQGRGTANDEFFGKLQGQTPWDDVIEDILRSSPP